MNSERAFIVSMVLSLTACATSFQGSAYIEDGRTGCEHKCAGQGLAMSGLVYMGEYSSACVCSVVGPGAATEPVSSFNRAAAAAAGGAAAGVMMQMEREDDRRSSYVVRPD